MCIRFPMGYSAPAWLMKLCGRASRRSRPFATRTGSPARSAKAVRRQGVGSLWDDRATGRRHAGPSGVPGVARADAADTSDRTGADEGVREAIRGRVGLERYARRGQIPPMRGLEVRAKSRKVFLRAVVISMLMGLAGFVFVEVRLKPTLKGLAEAKATEVGTMAVNDALSDTSRLDIRYEDLMGWKTDGAGNIVAVQPNTGEINRIAASTTSKVQTALRQIKNVKISIPLGQIFGSALLAGLGPWIEVSVVPIGVVRTTVTDSFEVAGINQLRHQIYLQLHANMRILVPLVSSNVTIDTRMPIAEAIILGDVPNFYMSTTGNPAGVLKDITGVTPQ